MLSQKMFRHFLIMSLVSLLMAFELPLQVTAERAISLPISAPVQSNAGEGELIKVPTLPSKSCRSHRYKVIITEPTLSKTSPEVADAIQKAFCDWRGKIPRQSTFKVVSLRLEEGWGLGTFIFDDADDSIHDPDNHSGSDHSASLVLAKLEGKWIATTANSKTARQVFDLFPEGALPNDVKETFLEKDVLKPVSAGGVASTLATTTASSTASNQEYFGYQLPWAANDSWKYNQYWHPAATKMAIDFGPNQSIVTSEILAMASGKVTDRCDDDIGQTWLKIATEGTSETFYYLHLAKASIDQAKVYEGDMVDQGQYLGILLDKRNWSGTCGYGSGPHLHLEFPSKPFRIEGRVFGSTDATLPGDLSSTQCSGRPVKDVNNPPAWVINDGRTIDGRKQCKIKGPIHNLVDQGIGIGNIEIKDNLLVILDDSSDKCVGRTDCTEEEKNHRIESRLNLHLSRFNLMVRSGSGLLIKPKSKIYREIVT